MTLLEVRSIQERISLFAMLHFITSAADIDASGLCVKDILDIPGLMDIFQTGINVHFRVAGLTYSLELQD